MTEDDDWSPPEYRFRCLGPFHFSTHRNTIGTRSFHHIEARDEVFDQAGKVAHKVGVSDIRTAVGLYVMGLSPSGSKVTWPYYVGRASKQTIYSILFQATDKPKKYSAILAEYERARPFVYLFSLLRRSGTQVRKTKSNNSPTFRVIRDAEYMMIGHAMNVNPWLYNVQHAIALGRFESDGTPQRDRRETNDARDFRRMMGFDDTPAFPEGIREASIGAFEVEGE